MSLAKSWQFSESQVLTLTKPRVMQFGLRHSF